MGQVIHKSPHPKEVEGSEKEEQDNATSCHPPEERVANQGHLSLGGGERRERGGREEGERRERGGKEEGRKGGEGRQRKEGGKGGEGSQRKEGGKGGEGRQRKEGGKGGEGSQRKEGGRSGGTGQIKQATLKAHIAALVKPIWQGFPHQGPVKRGGSKLVLSQVAMGSCHVNLCQRV